MEHVNGHGEKLKRKQEVAISALLQAPTVKAAAALAGVGETTLTRWMRESEFSEEYDAARRAVLDTAIVEVQALAGASVAKLGELLECGVKPTELRAAEAILDRAFSARSIYEHEERIRLLERAAQEQEDAWSEMERQERLGRGG